MQKTSQRCEFAQLTPKRTPTPYPPKFPILDEAGLTRARAYMVLNSVNLYQQSSQKTQTAKIEYFTTAQESITRAQEVMAVKLFPKNVL